MPSLLTEFSEEGSTKTKRPVAKKERGNTEDDPVHRAEGYQDEALRALAVLALEQKFTLVAVMEAHGDRRRTGSGESEQRKLRRVDLPSWSCPPNRPPGT